MESTITERKTVTLEINIKKLMPNLLWVLKAQSTDKNRHLLNYLNIDENGFCCTDGRRLHLCSDLTCLPNGLENGLYQVNICKNVIMFIPKEGEFPKYMDVIPKYESESIKIDLMFGKYNSDNKNATYSTSLVKISSLLNYKNTINIDFLKDLEGYAWNVQGLEGKSVKFVAGINTAIVMPLKME